MSWGFSRESRLGSDVIGISGSDIMGVFQIGSDIREFLKERDDHEQQKIQCSPLVLSGEVTLGEYIELLSL